MTTPTRDMNELQNNRGTAADSSGNFIREIIDRDLAEGTHESVVTRFPPEPNGYLHIGHAKSIVLNFELARDYGGRCHLRFDDTNPETENQEYIDSIIDAVSWLGYDWGDHLYFASDYFEQFYEYALKLTRDGKAYVDSLSGEQIREYRGSLEEPGTPSPYRDRSVEENLKLFKAMRAGKYENGEHVLRAKIDMASPHLIMRDPLLYRIRHAHHYRQGNDWCIYPMYDFAHPLEDAIENVTHSLCTLEFDTNRALYDWVLENCLEEDELSARPHQYEFARLNLSYTVMSKRKLLTLIEEGNVDGWDDPRLPTLMGMRRRGVPAGAIRTFCREIGVTRTQSSVQMSHFEHVLRDDLNYRAPRILGVVNPVKVVITNYPEDETDWIEAPYWPRDIDREGSRKIPFTRHLYIDRDDFREDPPDGFHRLYPGNEVRLRYGYFITCDEVIRGNDGEITELRCSYDPETRGGGAPDGRSPKGTLHWVSADHALPAEFRQYDRLFTVGEPDAGEADYHEYLNPDSLRVRAGFVEPSLADAPTEERYQFERVGYFWQDPDDSAPDALILNEIVELRDSWAEQEEAERQAELERQRQEKELEKARQRRRSRAGQGDPAQDLSPEQEDRFVRYMDEFELDRENAAVIARDDELAEYFEETLSHHRAPVSVANWIVNRLIGVRKEVPLDDLPFGPEEFGTLVALRDQDVINSRAADAVFEQLASRGGDPEAIVDEQGLRQIHDSQALEPVIDQILGDHPEEVEQYRQGKEALLGFFMGQVMRETDGSANPELAKELLRQKLQTGA